MTLQAASREALAAVELTLLDTLEGAATDDLGEQLFAVVGVLDQQIGLRRALADSSTDAVSRERLVRELFGGKISDSALAVVAAVATTRWSSPRELVDGLESLGTTALLVRAERAGRLDAVEDELFRLGRIIADRTELEQVLSDRSASREGKLSLIRGLIGAKTDPTSVVLVENLIGQPRGRDIVSGLEDLAAEAAKRRERSVAHVVAASPLTEAQQEQLSAALQRIYARPIALHLEVDPDLGGGMIVRVGDEVIDGSVAGRLDALRRRFAA